MKITTITVILLLILSTIAFGQNINKTQIVSSNNYYYGAGISRDFNEAKDYALKELTGQIAIRVASTLKEKILETVDALNVTVESIVKTHSAATLKNVQTITKPTDDGRIEVFCYLEKSKVAEIFNERKKLIAEMVSQADKYAIQRNAAFALKLYYFAAILLNSLPDQNIILDGINYTTLIPERVNGVILDTKLVFIKDRYLSAKEREITLKASYKNHPVSLLDFTFWDGSNQVSVQARDGLATFELLGPSIKFDKLSTNLKYAYYECRHEYNIVADLWPLVSKPEFTSQKMIRLEKYNEHAKPVVETGYKITLNYDEHDNPPVEQITQAAADFLKVLETDSCTAQSSFYSDDPFLKEKVCNYLNYNNPKSIDSEIKTSLNKTRNGWELRRLRMRHTYPSLHKQTIEYLVLDFSEAGKLVDLNTSITDYLYQEFVKTGELSGDWGNRQDIIKFLEKYRMAYLVRDIKTVDMMFAEEALIIIGRLIQTAKLPPDMVKYQKLGEHQPEYEYIELSKAEYMNRQKYIFSHQDDIFLDFGSFDIIKKNDSSNVYGVEMRQSYASTTYGDEGYLFLLIDFNEPDPLIYIRVWQPNAWNDDELIRTANIKIHN